MQIWMTSFLIGLLATTSPCVFPLFPGFLAYISGSRHDPAAGAGTRYFLGFFVLAGVLTTMLALGGLIAALSISIGRALSVVIPLADLLIITLGIALCLDRNPFKGLPQIRIPVVSHPFANAFLYGLLYGPIALPCWDHWW
jgi:cytochrome c-type biogenesis protein